MALVATLMAINAAYASQYGGNKNSPILIATMEHLENEEAGGVTPEKKSPNLDTISKNTTFEKGTNTMHHIHPDRSGSGGGSRMNVSVAVSNGRLGNGGGIVKGTKDIGSGKPDNHNGSGTNNNGHTIDGKNGNRNGNGNGDEKKR